MEKKGQVFSLDVLISVVLIIVALGAAMRFFELKEYEAKEMLEKSELDRVGNTASELLVNNPALVCYLEDIAGNNLGSLSNCLEKSQSINKASLGIPSSFDCQIKFGDGTLANGECRDNISPETKNVFAARRNIVIAASKQVAKNEFNDCINGEPCDVFTEGSLDLKVWKNA